MESMDLTKEEVALLLYLETCAVDHRGRIDTQRMNAADFVLAESWKARGIINFGRIIIADQRFTVGMRVGTHWVQFTDAAFLVVARLRQERAERGWAKREYQTTQEVREEIDG